MKVLVIHLVILLASASVGLTRSKGLDPIDRTGVSEPSGETQAAADGFLRYAIERGLAEPDYWQSWWDLAEAPDPDRLELGAVYAEWAINKDAVSDAEGNRLGTARFICYSYLVLSAGEPIGAIQVGIRNSNWVFFGFEGSKPRVSEVLRLTEQKGIAWVDNIWIADVGVVLLVTQRDGGMSLVPATQALKSALAPQSDEEFPFLEYNSGLEAIRRIVHQRGGQQ